MLADLGFELSSNTVINMVYTNYRGETSERRVKPIKFWFGETEWHPGKQWLMEAYDFEKHANRSFAMKDVRDITGLEEVAV